MRGEWIFCELSSSSASAKRYHSGVDRVPCGGTDGFPRSCGGSSPFWGSNGGAEAQTTGRRRPEHTVLASPAAGGKPRITRPRGGGSGGDDASPRPGAEDAIDELARAGDAEVWGINQVLTPRKLKASHHRGWDLGFFLKLESPPPLILVFLLSKNCLLLCLCPSSSFLFIFVYPFSEPPSSSCPSGLWSETESIDGPPV